MKNPRLLFAFVFALFLPTAKAVDPARIVFMIAEDQYQTAVTLPEFADTELKPRGCEIIVVNGEGPQKNDFPGLVAALRRADLLVLSVRRHTPPKDQLDAVRAYLAAGKPLVGIRTACHAFALRPKEKLADASLADWPAFDPEVLGGNYHDHHKGGPTVTVVLASGAATNPIVQGVSAPALTTVGPLYKCGPLAPDATPLLIGSIPDQPAEPLAWTRLYGPKKARVFFTSLGTPDDFKNPAYRRLLANGVFWAMGR